jgi:hypothetical protein
MKKLVLSLLAAGALIGVGTQTAQAVTLADLLAPGAFLDQGDKRFHNFSYLAVGDMPTANLINVVGINDIFGNFGIRFQGAFADNIGGGASDALIGFQVTVLDPLMRITDAHIFGNPSVIGGDGLMAVTESFPGQGPPTIDIFDIVTNGVHNSQADDMRFFNPGVTTLTVLKDIFANSITGVATLSVIDQSFSQTGVPEPGTMAMLCGLGVGGSAVLFRRRRRA